MSSREFRSLSLDDYLHIRNTAFEEQLKTRDMVALRKIEKLLLEMNPTMPEVHETAYGYLHQEKCISNLSTNPEIGKQILSEMCDTAQEYLHANCHLHLVAPCGTTEYTNIKGTHELTEQQNEEMMKGCLRTYLKLLKTNYENFNPPITEKTVTSVEEMKNEIALFFKNQYKSTYLATIIFIGHGGPTGLHLQNMPLDDFIEFVEKCKEDEMAPHRVEIIFTQCFGDIRRPNANDEVKVVSFTTRDQPLTQVNFYLNDLKNAHHQQLNAYAPEHAAEIQSAEKAMHAGKSDSLKQEINKVDCAGDMEVESTTSVGNDQFVDESSIDNL